MSEKDVEKIFNGFKNRIIKQVGNKALYDTHIDKICHNLFASKYGGTFPQDSSVEIKNNKYYIINTDKTGNEGIHWVALYTTPKKAYMYDSYARTGKKVLPILSKKLSQKGYGIQMSDRSDVEQDDKIKKQDEICGQLCISWLLTLHCAGIKKAMLI